MAFRQESRLTITEVIFNFTSYLCIELKKRKGDKDQINKIIEILPHLIALAEKDPNRKVNLVDIWGESRS
jgi:hypothetical protein